MLVSYVGSTLFGDNFVEISLLVIGATEVHPVSSRTRQLSPSALMVLGGQPPGRVGHRQETFSFYASLLIENARLPAQRTPGRIAALLPSEVSPSLPPDRG